MDLVKKNKKVVIICIGLMMIIGLSIVEEGLGLNIKKGYIYEEIGF